MPDLNDFLYPPQPEPKERLPERHPAKISLNMILHRGKIDIPFTLLTYLLLTVGLVMLLSASYARAYYDTVTESGAANPAFYFKRQLVFAAAGTGCLIIMSFVRLRFWRIFAVFGLLVAFAVLLLVALTGLTGGGATRWLAIGGSTFQPSELVKLAVVLGFAHLICSYGEKRMQTTRYGVVPFAVILVVFGGLLMMQPHLSCTIIIFCVGALMMYVGGTRGIWYIALIVAAGLAVVLIRSNPEKVFEIADSEGKLAYIFKRLSAWIDPYTQSQGDGYQQIQSLYAIGSGGLLGLGLGNSRQKYLYLPAEHNDYIFAIVCEELGFIGAALILLLFALLILRGFWIALQCRDKFDRMMVVGLTGLLTIQVFLNIGVVTNLIPSTGITLPFFSYGGSALVVQLLEIGMILSASRDVANK